MIASSSRPSKRSGATRAELGRQPFGVGGLAYAAEDTEISRHGELGHGKADSDDAPLTTTVFIG
jgi:hypothetical protein